MHVTIIVMNITKIEIELIVHGPINVLPKLLWIKNIIWITKLGHRNEWIYDYLSFHKMSNITCKYYKELKIKYVIIRQNKIR